MKMCNAMSKLGHDVVLIAPCGVEEKEPDVHNVYDYYGVTNSFKIKQLNIVKGRFGSISYAAQIALLLLKEKPELVYGRYCLGCVTSVLLGYNTIFETHVPFNELTKKDQKSLKLIQNKPNFLNLVVISDALKNMYVDEGIFTHSDMLKVAHDGADEYIDKNIPQLLEGEPSKIKLGYIGHLYKGRGIDILIELSRKASDFEFHIVGGTEEDIQYWKSIAGQNDINNLHFYGHVSPAKTEIFRASFDILLAPYADKVTVSGNSGDTSQYMSPLKIFEYMAHKKPILCTDLPVLREVLNDDNSILVKYNDIDAWLNAIYKLKDKDLRDKLSDQAYSDFMSKYTWYKRAELLLVNINEK
jgi:glycosyltransferase involved in cell wall biosynthesis